MLSCNKIQRVVISGGNFKPDTLKPKEVVSLLLDDDELEKKRECFACTHAILINPTTLTVVRKEKNILSVPVVRQRQEEKRQQEESSKVKERKRKREKYAEKVQYTVLSHNLRHVKYIVLKHAPSIHSEEERGFREQEEKGGEPGHLSRAFS